MSMTARTTAIALLALGGCSEPAVEAPPPVARPVKIVTFGTSGDDVVIEYAGTVEAAQRSDMGFEVPGRVVDFLVTAGQDVQQDEVLARLDPADYQAGLDKALADRNAAEADFRRYQQAFEENAVTKQDLDLAQRNLEVSQAQLRTAEKALADTELRAPFPGQVAQKLVNDFANVQAKQPVLILQDDSSLEIDVNVPEQDWTRVRPGITIEERSRRARARVVIPAIADREFPAELKEMNTAADPVTRTYTVTFGFANPADVVVRPGMTGRVVLSLPPDLDLANVPGRMTLPSSAVLADENGAAYVWLVTSDMTVTRQGVTVGEIFGDQINVRDGLQPGSRVATSGVHNLREGMLVRAYEP